MKLFFVLLPLYFGSRSSFKAFTMKNSLICVLIMTIFSTLSIAQGSSIADIMNVAPVTVKADETTMEANEDYQKEFDEQSKKVDDLFAKHSEKFTKDVTELIQVYNKVLSKAIEQDVKNEKQKVATRVNALSMSLIRSKKDVLTQYNNNLMSEIRALPKSLKDDKEEELASKIKEYKASIDEEFEANQQVIKSFRSTEHLTTEVSN